MKKIIPWLSNNILLVITLFLLAFIPLYPKLPLLDVKHTWVYIRVEDILVAIAVLIFGIQLLRKKATLKTPLTASITIFWVIGLISLIYAIIFIFPMLTNVFPNVALLHYLRRIEYLSLFFIAYSAVRNKKDIYPIVAVLALTLIVVILYGLGQKGFLVGWENRFPAFSTMNEEFAKGIPLKISELARVPSTFAGHYDLAAYLVLLIPILGALVFGFKKWWQKILLFGAAISSLILLMMTASRVSFAVYLLSVIFMLIIHKQKKFIIPVVLLSILLLQSFEGLSSRYASTISSVDVVVDARTGETIGVAKPGSTDDTGRVTVEEKDFTGEDLPQGTGYINFPNKQEGKASKLTYETTRIRDGQTATTSAEYEGEYVVRKSLAYDVSFTTRFQGTWPRAIDAFKRNILTGSGYSSISLATDNNYLRILGEVGLLGLLSYLSIFLVFGIVVYRTVGKIANGPQKSFVLGVSAGLMGVALNAVLIDVFEASKVAFVMWSVAGLALGIVALYQKEKISILSELKNILLSAPAIVFYLFFVTFGLFTMIAQNFFVGDDFTWLRWAADCVKDATGECLGVGHTFTSYFLQADHFFYRPGTKLYFFFMFAIFWLHSAIYHYMSIFLHFAAGAAVFLLTLQVLNSKRIAVLASLLFLTLSVHFEQVFWISATGHLIASVGILASVLLYGYWRSSKKLMLYILAFLSALFPVFFHEFGIVTPLILLAYDLLLGKEKTIRSRFQKWYVYLPFLAVIPFYAILRTIANSHWQGGDYSYNLVKLPLNVIGNLVGYLGIIVSGTAFKPLYDALRFNARENIVLVVVGGLLLISLGWFAWKFRKSIAGTRNGRIFLFGLVFFVLTLLPFLGLGNITYRYAYLPSVGFLLMISAGLHALFEKYGKNILVPIAVFVIATGFMLYQYKELVRLNKDWYVAGIVTRNLVNEIDQYFTPKDTLPENAVFYFANVPIKLGEAWIFPVGLEDAIFLPFQNNPPKVVQIDEADQQLVDRVKKSPKEFLFEFQPDGTVTVLHKIDE